MSRLITSDEEALDFGIGDIVEFNAPHGDRRTRLKGEIVRVLQSQMLYYADVPSDGRYEINRYDNLKLIKRKGDSG